MKKIISSCLILILLVCCKKANNPKFKTRESLNSNIIKIDKKDYEAIDVDSIYENFVYIKPETTKNSIIGSYSKILFQNDKLYILDKSLSQQSIFSFNKKGKFLFKINAMGRGPGEYENIDDFYVDNISKHIGILSNSRIMKYNFEGKFLGELNFKNRYIHSIKYKNGYIYAYEKSYCDTDKCFAFEVFDLEGKKLYEDYPMMQNISHFPYNKGNYLSENSKDIYANFFYNDTIYKAGKNSLLPRFILDFGEFKLPQEEFKKTISMGKEFSFLDIYESKYVAFGLSNFAINDDYIYMLFNKNGDSYTALYSISNNKTKIFNGIKYQKNILFGNSTFVVKGKTFCSIVNTSEAMRVIKEDEKDDITNPEIAFDDRRIFRYNTIKNLKIDDNPILVLYDVVDF